MTDGVSIIQSMMFDINDLMSCQSKLNEVVDQTAECVLSVANMIRDSINEQAIAISEMGKSMENINERSQVSAEDSELISSEIKRISGDALALSVLVGFFRV